ncbi:hypothetical protein [Desulfurobacterium indicum]|uniref:SsuA/THI5-like domain-containing protein n=1 Tax=Desulfurobacterium indicum TaxID=1914305 RepID=A0A1R1MLP8_9BACT|nr:hypothetical protein [Desulfurobacterium indicum]OMH40679.1 hypothetical protein BLW93_04095 [Desulfurobacterium indicum]
MSEKKGLAVIAGFLILTATFLLFSGCKEYTEINILAENKYILLPFYAEKAYGKLNIKNSIITLNYSKNSAEFIKLLNLSKYNVIIVDNITYDFIKAIDNSWIKICSVGKKSPAIFKMTKTNSPAPNLFYALNTPLYRYFADNNTVYIDSFRELLKKHGIYFKEPLKSYKIIENIGKVKYLLCIRKGSPAAKLKNLKKILLLWQDGTTYIFDPAAIKYIMVKYNIKQRKDINFLNCI